MNREEIVRTMPRVRLAFDSLKQNLDEGRMAQAGSSLFGQALSWGEELRRIYHSDDRHCLMTRDPLTRFFVTRFRGMEVPADLAGAPPDALFLMAFTAFPYLDAIMAELSLGEHDGADQDGNWLVRRVLAGEDEGCALRVHIAGPAPRFDLMPVYQSKAKAMDQFIGSQFGGDFDAFLWRYVADHDLIFDVEQSWRSLV